MWPTMFGSTNKFHVHNINEVQSEIRREVCSSTTGSSSAPKWFVNVYNRKERRKDKALCSRLLKFCKIHSDLNEVDYNFVRFRHYATYNWL